MLSGFFPEVTLTTTPPRPRTVTGHVRNIDFACFYDMSLVSSNSSDCVVFFCLNVLDGKTVYREGKKYLRMQNINHFLRSQYFIIFVGLYCDMNWDNVMCWDAIPAGTTGRMPCPDYISGFSKTGIL